MSKNKSSSSKKKWVNYLKDSKLSSFEVQRRAEWYSFHKEKAPKGNSK